jgi:hypothetical protein
VRQLFKDASLFMSRFTFLKYFLSGFLSGCGPYVPDFLSEEINKKALLLKMPFELPFPSWLIDC